MIVDPDQIDRILIRANNWIGDVVMISPALRALRETFPSARIDALIRPHVVECFTHHPSVDDVIVEEPARSHTPAGLRRLAARLKGRRYDLAVLFQKAIGAALLAWLARIPRRIGYDTDRRGFLLTHPIHETPALRRIHHVEYFLTIARAAGCRIGPIPRRVYFPVDDESRAFARSFLAAREAERYPLLAAFAVGASKPQRAWHADRFAALARRLVRERSAGILVVGGERDRDDAGRVLAAAGKHGLDAVGCTTVRQMAALLERCGVFVGNDSGPMHVAAALSVPILAMFGPGSPAKTAPYMPAERFVALSEQFHCSPCRQDFFRECSPAPSLKPMCLEALTLERASRALSALLDRSTG
ncbi:MAG: lipopolysaccharide heptosyltransferase II [Acidobacteriota bacterium]